MKKFLLLILTFVSSGLFFTANGQANIEPTTWSQKFSTNQAQVGDIVDVVFSAPIEDHHYIYSNDYDLGDCGPQKTKIKFEKSDLTLVNGPTPVGAIDYVDEIWELVCGSGDIRIFKHEAKMVQKVKVTGMNPKLSGTLSYQICNDGSCLDFTHDFSLTGLNVTEASQDTPDETKPTSSDNPDEGGEEPTDEGAEGDEGEETTENGEEANTSDENEETEVVNAAPEDDVTKQSLWTLFLLGMGGGLLALFTPCVFPMIPMTVAFFTKQEDKAKGKKMALFYGFSIVGIYIILGMLLAMLFGATFAHALSTHWLPNVLFFLIFIFFALSFLGMFELTLPSGFVNKMDAKGDRGGYLGVFFIAFTLVLVSFSCTAPIVGSVSILAASGEIMKPLAAMLGFSLMFAIPFTLFAFFPQWMKSLPQSGGWLNSVKVFLGFAELALAFKFLSQADLAYHWGILDRDVFLSIWIVLSIALGAYFLGKIKFPHDSDMDRIPVPRFLMAVAAFSFGIYLIPGLWGAPLKPLSGLLPPMTTQDYVVLQGGAAQASTDTHDSEIRYSDILHLPHGLTGIFVYEDALAKSKEIGKPVFVDFTGHTCANCRKMEEYVWVKPEVLKRLQNNFVIASLYTDERKKLPKDEQYTNKDGDKIETLADRNKDLQLNTFNSQGQPYYYIVDEEGTILSIGGGYDPDETKFIKFLDEGFDKYNNR